MTSKGTMAAMVGTRFEAARSAAIMPNEGTKRRRLLTNLTNQISSGGDEVMPWAVCSTNPTCAGGGDHKSDLKQTVEDLSNRRASCGEFDDVYMNGFDVSESDVQSEDCVGDHGAAQALARCQPVYMAWIEAEKMVPADQWLFTSDRYEIETVRIACLHSIFKYVHKRQLGLTTLHLAAHYLNRLFHYYIVENKNLSVSNTQCLVTAAGASMRTAIKMQERVHFVDTFRTNPNHLWQDFDLSMSYSEAGITVGCWRKNVELLNQMERVHLKILEKESLLHMPVVSDFLEQYLLIGGWPLRNTNYIRKLGQFLLVKSMLFTGRNSHSLKGVPPSKLAAGALVLSVKITNTHCKYETYEFWTKKLEHFTNYQLKDLLPVVAALSRMLRRNDASEIQDVMVKMFPEWGAYTWC